MERLTRFVAGLTRWSMGLCALLLVLLALYVSLGRQLVPLVAEYRADIESKAQAAVGLPLSIGSLEGRWHGLAPVLLAHDVRVGEGASALLLDKVQVVPDLWASLRAREVRIAHLELDGLQLSLKEDQDGHWALQGLPVQGDQPLDPGQLLTRLQMVKQLSVLDSQLTLQPFGESPLTLTYVGLNLQSGVSRQRLDLRLNLPDGQPLALNLQTRLHASDWRNGTAKAYLSLPQSDWARWLPARLIGQWKIATLKAGGEFWLNWGEGTVQSAVVRLNAPQFQGAYAQRQPASIDNLALNAYIQHTGQGFDVQLNSLAMNLGKTRWESHVQLQQLAATDKDPERWHLQADRLDLTPITPLLDALAPLPEGSGHRHRPPESHRRPAQRAAGLPAPGQR